MQKIIVRLLARNEVTPAIVSGINELLLQQHGRSRPLDHDDLCHNLQTRYWIVALAWDEEKVVGMGTLITTQPMSHAHSRVYNLVVRRGYNITATTGEIVKLLTENGPPVQHTEARLWGKNIGMAKGLKSIGFVPRKKTIYRLPGRKLPRRKDL